METINAIKEDVYDLTGPQQYLKKLYNKYKSNPENEINTYEFVKLYKDREKGIRMLPILYKEISNDIILSPEGIFLSKHLLDSNFLKDTILLDIKNYCIDDFCFYPAEAKEIESFLELSRFKKGYYYTDRKNRSLEDYLDGLYWQYSQKGYEAKDTEEGVAILKDGKIIHEYRQPLVHNISSWATEHKISLPLAGFYYYYHWNLKK